MLGLLVDRWWWPGLSGLVIVGAACTPATAPETDAAPLATEAPAAAADDGRGDVDAPGEPVEIIRVIDGDSLEVLAGGQELEVRLIGINAPELRTLAGRETCAGQAAKDELVELLATGTVRMIDDGTDRFGRTLARFMVEGRSIAEAMVDAGWALALWSADDPGLTGSMQDAAAGERGWWGPDCGMIDHRLAVVDEQADAPGDDRERLDEEWVEVANLGNGPVELDGWTLRDETTSNRFALDDITIDPGASIRFRTGTGRSDGDDVYLGEDFPVWSNTGETVLLVDPDGIIAAHTFIDG